MPHEKSPLNHQHIGDYPIEKIIPYARNARTHSNEQVAQIAASIKEFGFNNPVLIDGEDGIIAGHGRVLAAQKLGLVTVPVIRLTHLTPTQKRAYILADNKMALNAGWDESLLKIELEDLKFEDFDLALTGFSDDEISNFLSEPEPEIATPSGTGALGAKFMVSPFSVLNAREGWWQERKRAWHGIGIQSELGRSDTLMGKESAKSAYGKTSKGTDKDGNLIYGEGIGSTSIFDPVLYELVYRWFSKEGSTVVDPFAGGSVRGVVASRLGRQYIGHELREEQVIENRRQVSELCANDPYPAAYVVGDSRKIAVNCADVKADLIFSCPPYADLEVYSNNEADISRLKYPEFKAAYFEIIKNACSLLQEDRFACFVVGEVRGKKGAYYNFVADTIQAFIDAGLSYYNEAILVTPTGTLALRAGKGFSTSRKLGKTHQNILVFVKGDGKKAADYCGVVEIDESLFESEAEPD